MSFGDEMFKTYPGNVHPFEMKEQQPTIESIDCLAPNRDGANWNDDELRTLLYMQPPMTTDEVAALLGREPGAINAIKTYMRKVILKPEQWRDADGNIPSKYGVVRRLFRIIEEEGIRSLPLQEQETFAALLPGTKSRNVRKARFLAKNYRD